jgi:hypothetical protein
LPEGNPNLSEEDPSRAQQIPNPAKESRLKSLDFLRRIEPFQELTPTPTAFFLFEADSRCKCRAEQASVIASKLFVGLSVFDFSSSGCFSKGRAGAFS